MACVLTAHEDRAAKIWDVEAGQAFMTFVVGEAASMAVFSPSESLVAVACDAGCSHELVKIYDVASGRCLQTLEHGNGFVRAAVFSPDESLLVVAPCESSACLWEVESGKLRARLSHTDTLHCATFSPDGSLIATGSVDGYVMLWEASGQHRLTIAHRGYCDSNGRTVTNDRKDISSICFSPDGQLLVTACENGEAKICDLSGSCLATLDHGQGSTSVLSALFSPDASLVLTGSIDMTDYHGCATLWETGSRKCRFKLEGHTGGVSSAVFCPNGSLVATACNYQDCRVMIWEAASGKHQHTLHHDGDVISADFSPDGSFLVTVAGNSAWLWEMKSGHLRTKLGGQDVKSAIFSKIALRVVQLSASKATGEECVDQAWQISCSSLSGEEMASILFVPPAEKAAEALRSELARALKVSEIAMKTFHVVLPSGQRLRDCDSTSSFSELMDCA